MALALVVNMATHRTRPRIDRTTLVMVAITLGILALGILAVVYGHEPNDPGRV